MAQIIALHESVPGALWPVGFLFIVFFLITLSSPALVRFVVLRRPVISLWWAILLAFVCGFIITVFINTIFTNVIQIAIPQSGQIYLLAAFTVYSFWVMHAGYRNYCVERSMEVEVNEQETEITRAVTEDGSCEKRCAAKQVCIGTPLSQQIESKLDKMVHKKYQPNLKEGDQESHCPQGNEGGTKSFLEKRKCRYEERKNKKYPAVGWALLAFIAAIACVYLSVAGEISLPTGYHWDTKLLMCMAAVLGIPSGLLLFFYILRFLIGSAVRSATNVTFLSILWLGIIVIALMCLCPPWTRIARLPSSNIKGANPVGYAFLWHPPDANVRNSGIAIDRIRLLLQILVVCLITGGLLFTLKTCQSKGRSSEP